MRTCDFPQRDDWVSKRISHGELMRFQAALRCVVLPLLLVACLVGAPDAAAAGQSATPASDVYAIGIVLYEMLTGRLPFQADSPAALALKHLTEEPPPITDLNPQVPLPVAQIIHKVLSKEPAARYRTADQLGSILQNYRAESEQATSVELVSSVFRRWTTENRPIAPIRRVAVRHHRSLPRQQRMRTRIGRPFFWARSHCSLSWA